jgi:hypothetical protein
MEGLMKFLEQYWGYTLIGSVNLGSIITFIIIQIKKFANDKAKNTVFESIVKQYSDKVDTVIDKYNAVEKQNYELAKQNQEYAKRIEYSERVQATTFKAISYIVMASKLPTEDKIALQTDFTNLATSAKDIVVAKSKEIVKEVADESKETVVEVADESKETVVEVVKNTVAQANNLLSKYTGEI